MSQEQQVECGIVTVTTFNHKMTELCVFNISEHQQLLKSSDIKIIAWEEVTRMSQASVTGNAVYHIPLNRSLNNISCQILSQAFNIFSPILFQIFLQGRDLFSKLVHMPI